jgi:MFS family permease
VAGRAIDRIGAKAVVQFGMFTTVVGLALFALLELNIVSFYLAGLAVGLGLSSLLGAPLRYLALHVGGASRRGASQGLLALMLGTGRMLGAALIGGVVAAASSELSGYRRAMLMLALACSLSLVASVWLRPDGRTGGSESASRT